MDVIENSFDKNEIIMSEEALYHFNNYRKWMFQNIYFDSPAKLEEGKARHVVESLFNFYFDMLKNNYKESSDEIIKRIVCDYIAGMTDRYAVTMYEEYFVPKPTSAAFSDMYLYKLAELNGLK